MALEKATTPEGLRVYVDTIPTAETAHISAFVGAGSVHEPNKIAGISHALEHCVHCSTEKFPNLKAYYDFCGVNSIESNAYTTYNHTLYYGNGPFVQPIMETLGERLFRAAYNPKQIAKEMLAINREAHEGLDDMDSRHETLINYGLFGKPYGRDVIGYVDKLNFTPDQLKKYYRHRYTLSNMAIVAVGNVRMEELLQYVEETFPHESAAAVTSNPRKPRRINVDTTGFLNEEADNAQLSITTALDKTFVRKYLASPILFDAAMTAIQTRSHEKLRYDAGISYDGYAYFRTDNHPNAWSIQGSVTVAPKKIKLARKIFADVFEQPAQSYNETEIASAIGLVRGGILQSMDSLESRVEIYVKNLDCKEEPEDLRASANKARHLSHEEVRYGIDEIVGYLAAHKPLTHITGPPKAIKNADLIIEQSDIS